MLSAKWKLLCAVTASILMFTACTRVTPTPAPTQTLPPPTTTLPPAPTQTPPPSTATARPTATLTPAQFIGSACPFRLPAGLAEGQTLRCGYLSVPANRLDPLAGTLQLAVAILTPEDGVTQPDPIVYLEGGPGGSSLEFLYLTFERNFRPLLASGRSLILFDQRGVGFSRPALDCPEQDRLFLELLDNEINGQNLDEDRMDALNIDALATCAKNLAVRADLTGFTTAQNAADIADLARALDFESVNLWGVSYGTRLALEVLRSDPAWVRSVVLDSTVPPDVNLYIRQPENMVRSFDLLFEACAADPDCRAAYPDLRTVFFETVQQLSLTPAAFTAADTLTGNTYDVVISGDNFIDLVFQFLYDAAVIPILPRLISNVSQGNYDLLSLLAGSVIATHPAVSYGMHYILQCQEEIPFNDPQQIAAAAAEFPEFEDYFDAVSVNSSSKTCQAMGISAIEDPSINRSVASQIPTLILAGEYDPVTPPQWGEQAAASLENSYLYEFPGLSHGASFQAGCPQAMLLAFLDDPSTKPDAACLDDLGPPQWVIPANGALEMEPFTNAEMGLQGLKPAGWEEVSAGVYSRQSSSLDVALLLVQSTTSTTDNLLVQLTRQFGLQSPPEATGEIRSSRLNWTLYSFRVRNLPVSIGLAQSGERAIVVLLQSATDEQAVLYDNVFIPVLESIQPAGGASQ